MMWRWVPLARRKNDNKPMTKLMMMTMRMLKRYEIPYTEMHSRHTMVSDKEVNTTLYSLRLIYHRQSIPPVLFHGHQDEFVDIVTCLIYYRINYNNYYYHHHYHISSSSSSRTSRCSDSKQSTNTNLPNKDVQMRQWYAGSCQIIDYTIIETRRICVI